MTEFLCPRPVLRKSSRGSALPESAIGAAARQWSAARGRGDTPGEQRGGLRRRKIEPHSRPPAGAGTAEPSEASRSFACRPASLEQPRVQAPAEGQARSDGCWTVRALLGGSEPAKRHDCLQLAAALRVRRSGEAPSMELNHRLARYASERRKPVKVQRHVAPARRTPAWVPSTDEVRTRARLHRARSAPRSFREQERRLATRCGPAALDRAWVEQCLRHGLAAQWLEKPVPAVGRRSTGHQRSGQAAG